MKVFIGLKSQGTKKLFVSFCRFIMGSLDNWFFGEDDTGDLLARRNADKLVARAREVKIGHNFELDELVTFRQRGVFTL